jgi:hypothetical protein
MQARGLKRKVDVVKEPVVNRLVPLARELFEACRVPPVPVESPIAVIRELSHGVEEELKHEEEEEVHQDGHRHDQPSDDLTSANAGSV